MKNNIELQKRIIMPIDGIKETFDTMEIEGYASIFGNKDDGGDIVIPGAFSKWLSRNILPPLFYRHVYKIGKVKELQEDNKGLHTIGEIDKTNPTGAYVADMIRTGLVRGLSFAFDAVGYLAKNIRYIAEITDLKEISVTPKPLNSKALINQFKSNKDFYLHWKEVAIKNLVLCGLSKSDATRFVVDGYKQMRIADPETQIMATKIFDNAITNILQKNKEKQQ